MKTEEEILKRIRAIKEKEQGFQESLDMIINEGKVPEGFKGQNIVSVYRDLEKEQSILRGRRQELEWMVSNN